MYERVGTYSGEIAPLLELATRLGGSHGRNYTRTGPERTLPLVQPLLYEHFRGEWTAALFAIVWPQGHIAPHVDSDTAQCIGIRHHLVLQTNDLCWSFHNGTWTQLEARGVYYGDPDLTHAAINWGEEPRVHLMVDIQ